MNEFLKYDEGLTIEYKNYKWPFSPELIENIKRQICGFLNSQGGRIYIGISDNLNIKGVYLNSKSRDSLRNEIVNYTQDFFPKCRTSKFEVVFVPLKNPKDNKFIRNTWIIKLIVKQGDVDKLYSVTTKGFISYIRLQGQSPMLTAEEITEEILKRKSNPRNKIDENEFLDLEPERSLENADENIEIENFSNLNKKEDLFSISVQSIPKVNKNEIINIFKDTNYVSERIFVDKNALCQGWAFFNYQTENDALIAIEKTKGAMISGIRISIKLKGK
jgi:predicted HTH transcriptional regulator